MDASTIKLVASHLGKPGVEQHDDWLHISCPLAQWTHQKGTDSSPSFGIQIKKSGTSRMHCFACHFSGDLHELLLHLKTRGAQDVSFKALYEIALDEKERQGLSFSDDRGKPQVEFQEFWLSGFDPWSSSVDAVTYLNGRKGGEVPDIVKDMLDLRWDDYRKRVCFPIRDQKQILRGLHGRSVNGHAMKYFAYPHKGTVNTHYWHGEHLIAPSKPIVIAESVFDMARVFQVYRNVIDGLSSGLNPERLARLMKIAKDPLIVTLFDMDAAGDLGRDAVWKAAHKKRSVKHVKLAPGWDAGDTTAEALGNLLSDHLTLDKLLA